MHPDRHPQPQGWGDFLFYAPDGATATEFSQSFRIFPISLAHRRRVGFRCTLIDIAPQPSGWGHFFYFMSRLAPHSTHGRAATRTAARKNFSCISRIVFSSRGKNRFRCTLIDIAPQPSGWGHFFYFMSRLAPHSTHGRAATRTAARKNFSCISRIVFSSRGKNRFRCTLIDIAPQPSGWGHFFYFMSRLAPHSTHGRAATRTAARKNFSCISRIVFSSRGKNRFRCTLIDIAPQPSGWGHFFYFMSRIAPRIWRDRAPKALPETNENFLPLSGDPPSTREYKQTDAP